MASTYARRIAPARVKTVTAFALPRLMFGRDHLQILRRAEHTMGMPAAQHRLWTVEEVRQLTADNPGHWPRYELIDGELLVSPAPRYGHQGAVLALLDRIRPYTRNEGLGATMLSPSDLTLHPGSITQPDLFVVDAVASGRIRDWPDVRQLLLAVEVISPSTASHDRVYKLAYYQSAGVPEYWIVDLDEEFIERWRPGDDVPEILRDQLEWNPPGASIPLRIQLREFFAELRDR